MVARRLLLAAALLLASPFALGQQQDVGTYPLDQNGVAASALKSATTTVIVSAASAPSNGQVLTATSSTAAAWQTPTVSPTGTGAANRLSLWTGVNTLSSDAGLTYTGTGTALELGLGAGGKLTSPASATLQLGALASATPTAQVLQSQAGTGPDVKGANLTIRPGPGTGTGGSGNLTLQTAPAGTTGGTANVPADRMFIAAKNVTLTESSATPIMEYSVAQGTVAGGNLFYTVRADDATNFQSLRGEARWSAVNKGGVLTTSIALVGADTVATSSGTLACAASITTGTNAVLVNLNCVSSLTQTNLFAYVSGLVAGTGTVTYK